ncbi:glycosyltransferase family 9 protein [Rudaeicoccus suwonensis]|nr:glycosyltransferase family 9 protein [Rudaeicoccus suwonensis]
MSAHVGANAGRVMSRRSRARADFDTIISDRVARSVRTLRESPHPVRRLPTAVLGTLAAGHHLLFNLKVASIATRYALQRTAGREPATSLTLLSPGKALVVIDGNLGDCVMATRSLAAVHEAWPGAQIDVLTNRPELFSCFPYVRRCLDMPKVHSSRTISLPSLTSGSAVFLARRARKSAKTLIEDLASENYDVAVAAQNDTAMYLTARAEVPVRIGRAPMYRVERALRPCLTHPIPSGSLEMRFADPTLSPEMLRDLGLDVTTPGRPELWVDSIAALSVDALLEEWGVADGRFVILHTSARSPARRWPDEYSDALAKRIHGRHGWKSLWIAADKSDLATSNYLTNTTGRLSLSELVALIDVAPIVITTDSGPLHIAGTLGRPTVGLFRSRNPIHQHRYASLTSLLGTHSACREMCGVYRCLGKNPHLLRQNCAEMVAISPEQAFFEADRAIRLHTTAEGRCPAG